MVTSGEFLFEKLKNFSFAESSSVLKVCNKNETAASGVNIIQIELRFVVLLFLNSIQKNFFENLGKYSHKRFRSNCLSVHGRVLGLFDYALTATYPQSIFSTIFYERKKELNLLLPVMVHWIYEFP